MNKLKVYYINSHNSKIKILLFNLKTRKVIALKNIN